ncbi:MAG TPA: antitoxin VapB family protein [Thermoplasmata archaeon]
MAVKTITVTEDAYRKLARLKRSGESFSDVINRVLGGPSAKTLIGVLDAEGGDDVEREVRRMRRDFDASTRKRSNALRR